MAILPSFKYEAGQGTVHLMKLTAAIGGAGGTEPTGAIDSDIRPKLYKSDREFGIRPRFVTCALVNGTAPNQFITYKRVPVFTETAFASAAYQLGATLAINTVDHEITGRVAEDF